MTKELHSARTLPVSASNLTINCLGFACGLLSLMLICQFAPHMPIVGMALTIMAASTLPIVATELILLHVYNRPSTGLKFAAAAKSNPARIAVKLLGLVATLGIMLGSYWLFPEYGSYYARYWMLISYGAPLLIVFAIPYFYFMDGRMLEPMDGYWHLGNLLLLRREADWKIISRHLRNWLVKAFFLPLMFIFLCDYTQTIVNYDFHFHSFMHFYDFAYNLIYFSDVIFACAGYMMTFRILDSHIRSSEPTFLGWAVAVMCYPPFWNGLVSGLYFQYDKGRSWDLWFAGNHNLLVVWGTIILILSAIYAFSTICFGIRFSNLTYRGIITSGPYRFTKHPAYVAKNLSWWMISMPFMPFEGTLLAVNHSLLLLALNIIYYFRARTEERHLSAYPEYVEYGLYMNEYGVFRWVVKILPFLRYKVPSIYMGMFHQ